MPALHLGVIDVPYGGSAAPAAQRGQRTRPPTPAGRVTTGDVAMILEARYKIMETFVDLHGDVIEVALADAMQDRLETLLAGGPPPRPGDDLLPEGALGAIEQQFREMLDRRELDGRVPGVPTQAAQAGVSRRMQNPYAQRGPRPSFINSGEYQNKMRAWVEG